MRNERAPAASRPRGIRPMGRASGQSENRKGRRRLLARDLTRRPFGDGRGRDRVGVVKSLRARGGCLGVIR